MWKKKPDNIFEYTAVRLEIMNLKFTFLYAERKRKLLACEGYLVDEYPVNNTELI